MNVCDVCVFLVLFKNPDLLGALRWVVQCYFEVQIYRIFYRVCNKQSGSCFVGI